MNDCNPDKTALRRTFIVEGLPEPLEPLDDHIQIFENYVHGTRLRLRSLRRPSTDERRRFIETVEFLQGGMEKISSLELVKEEYDSMRPLRGREIRKNRYHYEMDGKTLVVDVYLGPLWGLNLAVAEFEDLAEAETFEPAPVCLLEVTDNEAFRGPNLVDLTFEDVRVEFAKAKGGG